MKLSKEELNTFKPVGNNVLVRSIINNDSVKVGDKDIYIDTSYKPEHHQNVICEVIATPNKLIFDRKRPAGESMEWKTTIDIKKGDIIWANYLSVLRGQQNLIIECGDIKYFLIDYSMIYLKKDKDKVVMLNGYILCSPVYVDLSEVSVGGHKIVLSKVKTADQLEGCALDTQFGQIKHIGKPISEYYSKDATPDDDYPRIDDIIMFVSPHQVRLEHELHRHFNGTDMVVSRRNRITAIVEF